MPPIKTLVNNAAEWVNTVFGVRKASLLRCLCVAAGVHVEWGGRLVGAEPDISGASAPRQSTPAHSHCVFSAAYSL